MSNLKINFGKNLQELRKRRNLSQEIFAELINISPRNLSKIETGKTFPSAEHLGKIAAALNCDLSVLFIFEKDSETARLRQELIEKVKSLTDEEIINLKKLFKLLS